MIDRGNRRSKQVTGKNAADFVDWKFKKDYYLNEMVINAMIVSHCDEDHYGGLWDLIKENEQEDLYILWKNIKIESFYHAGLGRWETSGRKKTLGKTVKDQARSYLVQLLDDKESIKKALDGDQGSKLYGPWAKFMKAVLKKLNNNQIKRLTNKDEYIPGFSPSDGPASLRVLGSIETKIDGKNAYFSWGSKSQDSNGNSILLRLDYGSVRILLTGDLNKKSQKRYLKHYKDQLQEFACDVAKSCHHGSEDYSFEFLSRVNAGMTVISSGDNESYGHPRPSVISASGLSGYKILKSDKIVTPLIYSTEISRSINLRVLDKIVKKNYKINGDHVDITLTSKDNPEIYFKVKRKLKKKNFNSTQIAGGIIYGLVNVRTDSKKILCATRDEKNKSWEIETFQSRF
ncbi:hypothetical protein LCGC14_0839010 [marine sediment metagenome]|uniref:Metallo-beta-lactamase domain-containing protein n=1 Tax=marine sediment metagenome TaxID=412755 RepID=A0A0F9PYZ1_9ZZZZ